MMLPPNGLGPADGLGSGEGLARLLEASLALGFG
jgi:hypothetical protein